MMPALLLVPIHLLLMPLPHWLTALLLAACFSRMMFVYVNAAIVALKLNSRRAAFLKSAGYDLSPEALLTDRDAWKASLKGGTILELLMAIRSRRQRGL